MFRRVAALRPDIVSFSGDFTSFHERVLAQAKRVLAGMPRGRLDRVGVLGNHDYGQGPSWSDYAHADMPAASHNPDSADQRWMYIGRGVGHLHLQASVNARPELTVFPLRRR